MSISREHMWHPLAAKDLHYRYEIALKCIPKNLTNETLLQVMWHHQETTFSITLVACDGTVGSSGVVGMFMAWRPQQGIRMQKLPVFLVRIAYIP